MFSRIKGAIDQTIAQEQARQKALSDQRPSGVQRTNSTHSPARRSKKPSQDNAATDTAPANPDPAVFEAAFVIDEEDGDVIGRASTPKPPVPEKEDESTAGLEEKGASANKDGEVKTAAASSQDKGKEKEVPQRSPAPASTELPDNIKAKLRKLEKLESTYPELLRSYRIAHGRATSIEPFERTLRENTPLTTIKDPAALVEYLNQLNLKGDMVMEELKRVSAEKDSFKKRYEEAEKEASSLKEQVATLQTAQSSGDSPTTSKEQADAPQADENQESKKDESGSAQVTSPSAVKSPVSSILGVFSPKQKAFDETKNTSEDMFSYDDEIPQLQAEVSAKTEEVAKLQSEISTLKEELAVAKENSTGLVENLESATRELSESRDKASAHDSLQTQLEARNAEIKSLTEKLEETKSQLREVESGLEKEKKETASLTKKHEEELSNSNAKSTEINTELKKVIEARNGLEKRIDNLSAEIDSLKKSKSESEEKVKDLQKQVQATAKPASAPSAVPTPVSTPTPATSGGSKKNNKKKNKKKGGAATAAAASAASTEATPSETSEAPQPLQEEGPDAEALQDELNKLKEEISEKDARIDRLSQQRKTEEDLREEIETMRDDLINIGQEHVEAKEKIKILEAEKTTLQGRITELEKEIEGHASATEASSKLQAEYDSMKSEFDELQTKSQTLQSDLGAAQELAQNRYKDVTDLRNAIQKVQPELRTLRQESATLKTTREELASKQDELRSLEKREKDLKNEVARVQRVNSDKENDIQTLNGKLAAEKTARARIEDEKRVAGRDFRRAEAEKVEVSAKLEKAQRELESVQNELTNVRPKVKDLEAEVNKLRKESNIAKEEAELKVQQYNDAQNLLNSMRDQTAEVSLQLKEAQSQSESLEEELAEVQKHLLERTREGETMRRMLADVDERADSKVREMRARMEAAVEERDRIEDESSTLARRRARESEDLKSKVRELERDVKTLANEKDDLEAREREWRRRREELESVEQKAHAEVEDMRSAVSNLRTALDASEQQVRDAERQRGDLRRLLDESRGRYDRVNRELKTVQGRLVAGGGGTAVADSGRSSMDSSRSGSVMNGAGAAGGAQAGPDTMYLKTILLQFLEVKDEKVRGQLVPVLGKLLRFDRNDEQKWMAAVQHLSKPGR